MRYWDDVLESGGVRREAVAALVDYGIGGTTRGEVLGALGQLKGMTREQLAAVPGLNETDVNAVLRAVNPDRASG